MIVHHIQTARSVSRLAEACELKFPECGLRVIDDESRLAEACELKSRVHRHIFDNFKSRLAEACELKLFLSSMVLFSS